MNCGDKILYRLDGKIMWKRGEIKGYPTDDLIEIYKDAFGGSFIVAKAAIELKLEKPEEEQLVDPTVYNSVFTERIVVEGLPNHGEIHD